MVYKPLKDPHWKPGMVGASALMSLTWGYLVYGGSISTIWPLFGVANQLLGSMTLAIGTTILFRMGKAQYAWTTMIPMSFLTVTTVAAGYLNITMNYLPSKNYLLAVASGIMIVLVVFVIGDAVCTWIRIRSEQELSSQEIHNNL
jgi:carbon starvation protein